MEQVTQQIANSLHVNNLSTVLVNVPYRQPGNVVKHIPVVFTVWKNGIYFKAFALCNEETQRILNLPDALLFQLKHGKPTPSRQAYERIVWEIAGELTKINVID
jgi:hypothetical protein